MNGISANYKLWILLVVAIGAYVAASQSLSRSHQEAQHTSEKLNQKFPSEWEKGLKKATLAAGRVVRLNTTKGAIEFVLFERDCPKTTARIAELVDEGCYDGVTFGRVVPDSLIQTDQCQKSVEGMGCEFARGMRHVKGSVGMARGNDSYSNTSPFYILLEPRPTLDYHYTNFGRLIRGMDVAMRITQGDVITSAEVRELTDADQERLEEILTIESDRRTD